MASKLWMFWLAQSLSLFAGCTMHPGPAGSAGPKLDALALRYSLATVAPVVLLLSAVILRLGFASFEQTKAHLFASTDS